MEGPKFKIGDIVRAKNYKKKKYVGKITNIYKRTFKDGNYVGHYYLYEVENQNQSNYNIITERYDKKLFLGCDIVKEA